MRIALTILLSFAFYFPSVVRAAINRTIDDTYGDEITGFKPIYDPPTNVWAGPECHGCAIQPEPSKAHNGTWKAATYGHDNLKNMSITLEFKGTAIYVFFILANFIRLDVTTETACEFLLDKQPGIPYSHQGSRSRDMDYNALAFSEAGLQDVKHTLIISTSGFNRTIFVNFDYAIYTFDEDVHNPPVPVAHPSPNISTNTGSPPTSPNISINTGSLPTSPNSSTNTGSPPTSTPSPVQTHDSTGSAYKPRVNIGVVIGGAIGGVVVAIVLLTVCYRCRKRSVARHATNVVVGENLPPPAPSTERTPLSISKAVLKQGQIHRNLLQSFRITRPSPNRDEPNAPDSSGVNQLSTAGPRMESTLRPLTPLRAGRTTEIIEIREHIRLMQEQIESLQIQGPLAAANDPPPGYTSPRHSVVRADPPFPIT